MRCSQIEKTDLDTDRQAKSFSEYKKFCVRMLGRNHQKKENLKKIISTGASTTENEKTSISLKDGQHLTNQSREKMSNGSIMPTNWTLRSSLQQRQKRAHINLWNLSHVLPSSSFPES